MALLCAGGEASEGEAPPAASAMGPAEAHEAAAAWLKLSLAQPFWPGGAHGAAGLDLVLQPLAVVLVTCTLGRLPSPGA